MKFQAKKLNMNVVKISLTTKKEIEDFDTEAWHGEDIEHYGERVNWVEKDFAFKAVVDDKIAGSAVGKFEAGVIYLQTLIVAKKHRGKGIGKKLLDAILKWAKSFNPHKIVLFTMPGWKACKFYESLGFKLAGKLPNHYLKRDFVIYSKEINLS